MSYSFISAGVLIMKISQTRIFCLHLNLCVFLTLMTYAESKSSKIKHHFNSTVFVGKTVTLYCNETGYKDDITWKLNDIIIFRFSSFLNKTLANFTSDRMYINSAAPMELTIHQIQASDAGIYSCYSTTTALGWTLTITENRAELHEDKTLYIISSCAGIIMVCLIFGLGICIHRRRNNRDEGHKTPASRRMPASEASDTYECITMESKNQSNHDIYANVGKF